MTVSESQLVAIKEVEKSQNWFNIFSQMTKTPIQNYADNVPALKGQKTKKFISLFEKSDKLRAVVYAIIAADKARDALLAPKENMLSESDEILSCDKIFEEESDVELEIDIMPGIIGEISGFFFTPEKTPLDIAEDADRKLLASAIEFSSSSADSINLEEGEELVEETAESKIEKIAEIENEKMLISALKGNFKEFNKAFKAFVDLYPRDYAYVSSDAEVVYEALRSSKISRLSDEDRACFSYYESIRDEKSFEFNPYLMDARIVIEEKLKSLNTIDEYGVPGKKEIKINLFIKQAIDIYKAEIKELRKEFKDAKKQHNIEILAGILENTDEEKDLTGFAKFRMRSQKIAKHAWKKVCSFFMMLEDSKYSSKLKSSLDDLKKAEYDLIKINSAKSIFGNAIYTFELMCVLKNKFKEESGSMAKAICEKKEELTFRRSSYSQDNDKMRVVFFYSRGEMDKEYTGEFEEELNTSRMTKIKSYITESFSSVIGKVSGWLWTKEKTLSISGDDSDMNNENNNTQDDLTPISSTSISDVRICEGRMQTIEDENQDVQDSDSETSVDKNSSSCSIM